MMNDLISRDVLVEDFRRIARAQANARVFAAADAWEGAADRLANAPAVDAEPVRHGRWIQSKTVPSYHYCSRCRVPQKMVKSCNKYVFIHYCPYCGAMMDGGKDDENT